MKYITKTEKQTFNLGKKIAKSLKGGEVLALTGDLGAGKTILTKGLAEGLGIKKIVTSPTFILMNVYDIKKGKGEGVPPSLTPRLENKKSITSNFSRPTSSIKKLVHIDCYRLTNASELEDIGAIEYFGQADTVVVIEWAEKVKRILPKNKLTISIKIKQQNIREITTL